MKKRFIIIVLDSLGAGELPDAAAYNSTGANTLGHIAEYSSTFDIPTLQNMGISNIIPLKTVAPVKQPRAAYGKMASQTAGMDTTSGHWEMAGIVLTQRMPTYPHGFPRELIAAIEESIGRKVLGNIVASGTEIIQTLGEEHMQSGRPIVYTSADSVLQIAAHEEIIPLPQLYDICAQARAICQGEHSVGRVIARPFVGEKAGKFYRTANRKDFSLLPPDGNMLQCLAQAGIPVISVGKIYDVFAGKDISAAYEGHDNQQSGHSLYNALKEHDRGLIFANFVDFDSLYGHRNDLDGYRQAIETFDFYLGMLLELLREDDIFVITADHGNDPTTFGTDHNREYAPLLVYGPKVKPVALGIRSSFADLGQTAVAYLGAAPLAVGQSFLDEIIDGGVRR